MTRSNPHSSAEQSLSAAHQSPARNIFAVVNQKGGVGKTTTAVNLATALAAVGQKVLLVDLDPQGNASTGLGVSSEDRGVGSYEVLVGMTDLDDAILPTEIPNLWALPASVDLSGADIELVSLENREYCLKGALAEAGTAFDTILIDCPPSLSLLTINALTAAGQLLIPLQCEFYALEGLSQLMKTISRVQARLNPDLEIAGLVLTMYDQRNNLSRLVEEDARSYFGDTVFQAKIPRNVRISEAPSYGKPVLIYDHRCVGAAAYLALAKEFLARFGGKAAAQKRRKATAVA